MAAFTNGQTLTQTEFRLEHNSDGTHNIGGTLAASLYEAKGTILAGVSACSASSLALGTDGQQLRVMSSCPEGIAWVTPPIATCILAANVTLTTAGSYYDIVSITCTCGIWLLLGQVQVHMSTASNIGYTAKLWNGATVESSAEVSAQSAYPHQIVLSGCTNVATASSALKISCAANAANGLVSCTAYSYTAGSNATRLMGMKVG